MRRRLVGDQCRFIYQQQFMPGPNGACCVRAAELGDGRTDGRTWGRAGYLAVEVDLRGDRTAGGRSVGP
jgi:hypothetical protein